MIAGFLRLFIVFGPILLIVYLVLKRKVSSDSQSKKRTTSSNRVQKNTTNKPKQGYTIHLDSQNIAITEFNVAGVTFKDGRASRQTALRKLKFQDPPMDGPIDFEFEDYEYEGSPAILIKANGRILGNVPANLVEEFNELRNNSSSIKLEYRISGGGDYPFGCKMIITWKM